MTSPLPDKYVNPPNGQIVIIDVINLTASSSPTLLSQYAFPSGTSDTVILARYGAKRHVVLQAIGYKKQVRQIIKSKTNPGGPTIEESTFWVPVYRELDPVTYESNRLRTPPVGRGTNLVWNGLGDYADKSGVQNYIIWVAKTAAPNGAVSKYLWLGYHQGNNGTFANAANNGMPAVGWLVHSDDDYNYYWSDTPGSSLVAGNPSASEMQQKRTGAGASILIPANASFSANSGNPDLKLYYSDTYLKNPLSESGGDANGKVQYLTWYDWAWTKFYIKYKGVSYPVATDVEAGTFELLKNWEFKSGIPSAPAKKPFESIAYPGGNPDSTHSKTQYKLSLLNDNAFYDKNSNEYKINAQVKLLNTTNASFFQHLAGKYIVLPTMIKSSANTWSSQSIDYAVANFNTGTTFLFNKGMHLGIFDTSGDANAWADWINAVINPVHIAKVGTLQGITFIGKSPIKLQFNPTGLNGIPDSSWRPFSYPGQAPVFSNNSEPGDSADTAAKAAEAAANYDPFGLGPGVRLTMQNAITVLKQNSTKNDIRNILIQLTKNLNQNFEQVKTDFLESIKKAKIKKLVADGKSYLDAKAQVEGDALVMRISSTAKASPSGQGSSTTGNSQSPNQNNNGNAGGKPKTDKITITRGLIGYMQPPSAISSKPQLVQQYRYTKTNLREDNSTVSETVESEPIIFEFPFTPRDVQYSGLGSTWTEVARAGNYPIIDWQNFQLLKVSFTFDVVDKYYQNIEGYGRDYSVDEQLTTLRKMALAPYPVSFLNMDEIISKELRYPLFTKGRGVEFVITDLAITSVLRTGGAQSNISRASCTMTLQEIPIEEANIVFMPPIKPCNKKTCPPPPKCQKDYCPTSSTFLLQSSLVTGIKGN